MRKPDLIDLVMAVQDCGATLYLDDKLRIKRASLLPADLRQRVRDCRDDITAVILEARRCLTAALARWEAGCRWFAADPRRHTAAKAVSELGGVAGEWGYAMDVLAVFAPQDPALEAAYIRLDAVALETDYRVIPPPRQTG